MSVYWYINHAWNWNAAATTCDVYRVENNATLYTVALELNQNEAWKALEYDRYTLLANNPKAIEQQPAVSVHCGKPITITL